MARKALNRAESRATSWFLPRVEIGCPVAAGVLGPLVGGVDADAKQVDQHGCGQVAREVDEGGNPPVSRARQPVLDESSVECDGVSAGASDAIINFQLAEYLYTKHAIFPCIADRPFDTSRGWAHTHHSQRRGLHHGAR